jgi:membrane protease YdiL (CAAX protease family)
MTSEGRSEDDPYRPPLAEVPPEDPPPAGLPRTELPLTYFIAVVWSLGTTVAFVLLISVNALLAPPKSAHLLSSFACQVLAMLPGLVLIPRLHASRARLQDVFALRSTHPAFYPLAAMLGLVVQVPANALFQVIDRFYPSGMDLDEALVDDLRGGPFRKLALVLVIAVLGPLVEELFYRGALFSPMRRRHGVIGVVAVTSALFALAHVQWQMLLPIGIVGIALGVLRSESGSLWPSALMHGIFNGLTLISLAARDAGLIPREPEGPIPIGVTIGGSALTLVGLGLARELGQRSTAAAEARRKDQS